MIIEGNAANKNILKFLTIRRLFVYALQINFHYYFYFRELDILGEFSYQFHLKAATHSGADPTIVIVSQKYQNRYMNSSILALQFNPVVFNNTGWYS